MGGASTLIILLASLHIRRVNRRRRAARAAQLSDQSAALRAAITALPTRLYNDTPRSAASTSSDVEVEECAICFEVDTPRCMLIPCGHLCFCLACGRKQTACPICRVPVERVNRAIPL